MATVQAPFDLLEVKLSAPVMRAGTLSKNDVIARLRRASARLVSVVAPAGYGKTTLLAHWAEADPRAFAWVALDGRDDDPVVLLRYIAAAIHRVKTVPSTVLDALSGPVAYSRPLVTSLVGGALTEGEGSTVIVLDDLHLVANPACLDKLAELFRYIPAGSAIAIASREEPKLPLARWRAQGDVLRDRRRRAAAGRAGGRVRAGRRRGRNRGKRRRRADRPNRGLGGRGVSRGARAPSRGDRPIGRLSAQVLGRRSVRIRLLPARTPVTVARRGEAVPAAHLGPGSHARQPL